VLWDYQSEIFDKSGEITRKILRGSLEFQ